MNTTQSFSSSSKNDDASEELSLKYLLFKLKTLFHYLLSKWTIIIFISFIGAGIGLLYAFMQKPKYTATTTFVLEDGDKSGGLLGQYAGLASVAGVDIGGGSGGLFQSDNITQLYKSRLMIEKTLLSKVDATNLLIDKYLLIRDLRKKWQSIPQLKNLTFHLQEGQVFSRMQDSILNAAAEDISNNFLSVSKPDKKLSLIQVEVTSLSETFSKEFNDLIVKNVNDFYVLTKTKKTMQDLSILQHQTDSVRAVLNNAIFQTATVNDATPNLNPSKQILRTPGQRYQMNAEANKAILSQLIQSLELAKISLRKETPLIQVIDNPIFPLKKNRVGKGLGILMGGFIAGLSTVIFLMIKKVSNL
jgi:hypothetical protein